MVLHQSIRRNNSQKYGTTYPTIKGSFTSAGARGQEHPPPLPPIFTPHIHLGVL